MGTVKQFQEIVIIDAIFNDLCNCLELFEINDSVLIGIIKRKNLLKSVFGFGLTNL